MKLFFLVTFVSLVNYAFVRGKYMIHDIEVGNDKSYAIRIYPSYKNEKDVIYIKGSVVTTKDFGNDNAYWVQVYKINAKSNSEKQMVNMKGKGTCDALNKYVGGVFHEIEKICGIPKPGECPIPFGNYTLKDYYQIDFAKIPLFTMVPKAVFRLSFKMFEIDAKTLIGELSFKFTKA